MIDNTYEVRTVNGVVGIYEKTTNQHIPMYNKKETIDKICNELNWGSGFQGNTPSFFTINLGIYNESGNY